MRIEFTKTVTVSEYAEAVQRHNRRRKLFGYVYMAVIGLVFLALGYGFVVYMALGGAVILFLIWQVVWPLFVLPYQYQKAKLLQGEFSVVADDEGMVVVSEEMQSRTLWKAFTKFVESRQSFLLYLSPNLFVITPKRCLTPEQQEELRGFLSHILDPRRSPSG
jgi:hypothetical protein